MRNCPRKSYKRDFLSLLITRENHPESGSNSALQPTGESCWSSGMPDTMEVPTEFGTEDLKDSRRRKRKSSGGLERVPPASIEAERGVLGCLLIDPVENIGHCLEKLKKGSACFYDLRHQELYELLVEMYDAKQAIDLLTVQQRLKDRGKLEAMGGLDFLMSLPDATPSPLNLPYYVEIVREKHMLRRMVQTCASVVEKVYDPEQAGDVESLMDEVEKDILSISEDADDQAEKGIKELVHDAIAQIEKERG